MKGKLFLLAVIFLLPSVFATTYYLQIINPNDYDLADFQVRVNLTAYSISTPVAQITTLDGSNVPFCYEQPNGECNQTTTEVIWMKVPLIKGKDYTILKIVIDGTNGAVNGDQVFDFYDDFSGTSLDINKWDTTYIGGGTYSVSNSLLHFSYDGSGDNPVIISKNKFPTQNRAFEARWRINSLNGQAVGFNLRSAPSGNAYLSYFLASSVSAHEDTYIDVNADGSYEAKPNWLSWSTGEWYVTTHYFKSNEVIWERNGETYTYAGSFNQEVYILLGFYEAGQSLTERTFDVDFDWVRVRKYADQDPIVRYSYQGSFSEGTPSQTSTEYNQTYLYVRQVTVLPENAVSVSNAQVILELDTASLISEGKLQSDCSDIYVTYYDPLYGEIPAKFWVDPTTCNTKATRIYVKLPTISVNNDWIINVYYGSPGAIPMWDPKNTFTFYVDLANPSDISQNLIIRTEGTTTLDYTSSGLVIQTGSDGKVLIVNK